MKILFLGTSAGWPLPRLGCRCEICQSKDPKDKRLRPAVLVNETILIDAGPDIYHELTNLKVDTRKIKTLILTHAHPDHILGFYDLTHLYNREEKSPTLIATESILQGLKQIHRYPLSPFKLKLVKTLETIQLGDTKITLFPVKHSQTPCFGVKIKADRLFVYLPDLKRIPKNKRRLLRDVDLLAQDGSSLGKRGQTKIHQSITEGLRLGQDLKAKRIYFTHIGHLTGKHQDLEEFVQAQGGRKFHIAYDGLELNL